MIKRHPSIDDLLDEAIAAKTATIHTSIPGRVVAFDADANTVDVQPAVKKVIRHPDGSREMVPYAQIKGCPVAYPAGNGFAITWPLVEGDDVILHIMERSIDEWKATGGRSTEPRHPRRHDMTDAIAEPAGRPPGRALRVRTGKIIVGRDSGMVHPAAKGDVVLSYIKGILEILLSFAPAGNMGVPVESTTDFTAQTSDFSGTGLLIVATNMLAQINTILSQDVEIT